MDNTSNNNSNDGLSLIKRYYMMSNEDQLITVGFIVGFAAGVAIMIMITN